MSKCLNCPCDCKCNYKETVEAVFILDESGSMYGQESKVVSGLNENLQDMRRDLTVNYRVTLIKFASNVTVVYKSIPINGIRDFNYTDYTPSGCTSLLDAVGDAVNLFSPSAKVMLHVFTDGEENTSERFNYSQIKELLDSRQKVNHWAVVFMGANVEAWAQGSLLGISTHNTVNYANDTGNAFKGASYARSMYTQNVLKSQVIGWNSIDNDNLMNGFTTTKKSD